MSGKKSLAIPIFVGGFLLFIVVTAGGIFFVLSTKNATTLTPITNTALANTTIPTITNTTSSVSNTTSTPVSSVSNATTPTTSNNSMMTAYKDGTYTVDSSYYTPEDVASMKVSVTIASDKITSVKVTPEAYGESGRYQSRFASAVGSYIVGKNCDSAMLQYNISGASLTTDAFNIALNKIKSQALI